MKKLLLRDLLRLFILLSIFLSSCTKKMSTPGENGGQQYDTKAKELVKAYGFVETKSRETNSSASIIITPDNIDSISRLLKMITLLKTNTQHQNSIKGRGVGDFNRKNGYVSALRTVEDFIEDVENVFYTVSIGENNDPFPTFFYAARIFGLPRPPIDQDWWITGYISDITTEHSVTNTPQSSIYLGEQAFHFEFSGKLSMAISIDDVTYSMNQVIHIGSFYSRFDYSNSTVQAHLPFDVY